MGHKLVYALFCIYTTNHFLGGIFLEMTKTALFIKVNLMSC